MKIVTRVLGFTAGLLAALCVQSAFANVVINNTPLSRAAAVPGNLVLIPSVEWPTVVTQANDPGVNEANANYSTTPYAGYFNPNLCYAYYYAEQEVNRYFYPVSHTTTDASGAFSCAGQTGGTYTQKLWSGNFLNWASMQAIDTFRMALTGGYRVHVPETGSTPNVTIIDSTGTSVTKTTSERPDVTFLEKGNSDRWADAYTKLRRLTANANRSTPSATAGIRTRIAGLRNQMWFTPSSNGGLGSATSFGTQRALSLPVGDGNQPEPNGASISAIPYNPRMWGPGEQLPDEATTTFTNTTPCAANEAGCAPATPLCDTANGFSWNAGLNACAKYETKLACPNNGSTYFKTTSNGGCYTNSRDTTVNEDDQCGTGWTRPTSNGFDLFCTANNPTLGTATAQYTHTRYGRDQVYTVSIRVKVCDGALDQREFCTQYGNYYKPEGLLQKNAKKIRYSLFSYLTENGGIRDGGVMRARMKLIGPVTSAEIAGTEKLYPDRARIAGIDNPEWDPATGVLINDPDAADTLTTNSSIGTCNNAPDDSQCRIQYSGVINYLNRFGQINTGGHTEPQGNNRWTSGTPTYKQDDNVAEMYYTALRYLRGEANIAAFSALTPTFGSGALAKYQNADGFPVIDDWYKTGANAAARKWNTSPALNVGADGDPILYQCQTTVMLGIGDTATNSEDDADNKTKDGVAAGGTYRAYTEFSSGGNGRGNLAGLAYWAHLNDIRPDVPNNDVAGGASNAKRGQTVSTYWVDVVEQANLKTKATNQYYNATKYGGYVIPEADWDENGNARRHDLAWFESNRFAWTNATQTVLQQTGIGTTGDYYLPNNMFLANNGQRMIDGLTAAFTRIVDDLSGSGASLAANSTKLVNDTTTYQAVYFNLDWRGDIKAFAVDGNGNIALTPSWQASERLPAAAQRVIKTCTGDCGDSDDLVDFSTTATFDSKNALCLTPAACGTGEANSKINYLRGSAADEQRNGGTLRNRRSALGDIINSQPVFVGAPNVSLHAGKSFGSEYAAFAQSAAVAQRRKLLYVAANDGMLHAFNAETSGTNPAPGREMFAYLPKAVIKKGLYRLTLPSYGDESQNAHQFYNDGELTVADVKINDAWRSVLIGTTGRGPAKAVYALDVTDPTNISLLWERSAEDGQANSNYIGQIIGKPVVARVSGGKWVALMGNGYNSAANKPALLQFDLATGELSVYTTTGATNDGLSPPAVWISDATLAENISTQAYAGDLHGNVWEFQIAANGPNDGSATSKVFTAKDGDGNTQPITAGLVAAKNKADSSVWVFFGTGAFLSSFAANDGVQSWYGLIVQGANKVSSTSTLSDLRKRSIIAQRNGSNGQVATRGITAATDGDMTGKKGWYMELLPPSRTPQGERIVTPNQFQASFLIGTTRIPTRSDPCQPAGDGWIMAIEPFTGASPTVDFFDINNDGSFNNGDRTTYTDENGVTHTVVSAGVGFSSIPNNPIFVSSTMLISFDNATTGRLNTRSGPSTLRRVSWRELTGP